MFSGITCINNHYDIPLRDVCLGESAMPKFLFVSAALFALLVPVSAQDDTPVSAHLVPVAVGYCDTTENLMALLAENARGDQKIENMSERDYDGCNTDPVPVLQYTFNRYVNIDGKKISIYRILIQDPDDRHHKILAYSSYLFTVGTTN